MTAAESISFTHRGCSSPSLKELLKAVRLTCMGWPPFSCHRPPHWVNRSSKNGAGLPDQRVQFIPLPAEVRLSSTPTQTVIGAPTALHRSRGSIADTTCCVFTCSGSLVQPTGRTSQRSWLTGTSTGCFQRAAKGVITVCSCGAIQSLNWWKRPPPDQEPRCVW